jgi:predicted 2-oxoglutarate/Fe(II)-dependent dioxygenase YbiX
MFDKLTDYIHVAKGIIPGEACRQVVAVIEKREWRPHSWYAYGADQTRSEQTQELDVQDASPDLQAMLFPFVVQAANAYSARYAFPSERTSQILTRLSTVRFNRYSPGQIMRLHQDHIHSLFDGTEKGIPVFSIVGNLNDDYEGAEFYFWNDHVVPLGAGDILMFPSLFMYPHGVREAIRGRRYSFVSWAW